METYLGDNSIRLADAVALLVVTLDKEPPGDRHHLTTATNHHLNISNVSHTEAVVVVLLLKVTHSRRRSYLLSGRLKLATKTDQSTERTETYTFLIVNMDCIKRTIHWFRAKTNSRNIEKKRKKKEIELFLFLKEQKYFKDSFSFMFKLKSKRKLVAV